MNKVRFVPVIEVEPGDFRKTDIPLPNGTASENPNGWDKYWRKSLSESKIENIDPYQLGSWLVPLKQLLSKPKTLSLVLKNKLDYMAVHKEPVS